MKEIKSDVENGNFSDNEKSLLINMICHRKQA